MRPAGCGSRQQWQITVMTANCGHYDWEGERGITGIRQKGRTVPTQITDASRVLLATDLIIAACYTDLIAHQLTQQLKPVFAPVFV